jgi:hypothetical protein
MSRAPVVAAAGMLLALVVATVVAEQQPQAPTIFRATTDVVTVEALVRRDGTPVLGLTAADFELLDNGVRQSIESLSVESVPLDLSILVDANEDIAGVLPGLSDQMHRMVALVRRTDRLRVTTINGGVGDLVSAQPAERVELPRRLTPAGISSGGAQPPAPDRRADERHRRDERRRRRCRA